MLKETWVNFIRDIVASTLFTLQEATKYAKNSNTF